MRPAISLQHRAFYKMLMLFVLTFVIAGLVAVLAVESDTRNNAKQNLLVRTAVVEEVFHDYLTRAEYEMGYISQDLTLSDYQMGNELEMLFSHHEVLFFGGLDFFYIDWSNRKGGQDPRARVYTQDSLANLTTSGKINHWVKVTTSDGAILLMYKKKMVSRKREIVGYLYGFVSLNNNLTLASELLDGSQADVVQLYDRHSNALLLQESNVGFDPANSVVSVTGDIESLVEGSQFRVGIVKRVAISDAMVSAWLRVLLFIFLVLAVLYALLTLVIKRLVFTPLNTIAKYPEKEQIYTELQPIQAKSTEYRRFLNAKESRFQLLLESTHSAIIFCNEMAEVKEINHEAMGLFPQYKNTRTIFDFMPISCHQAIQEALKGSVGITFELTLNHANAIYHWQAYSFINEDAFRSLVLVGRDTTEESRLSWQLEQLKPSALDLNKRLDVEVLLSEMSQLSKLSPYSPKRYVQGWIGLLLDILEGFQSEKKDKGQETIGQILNLESNRVIQALGLEVSALSIDCPVAVGATVIASDYYLTTLFRLSVMMAVASDMSEKSLSIHFDDGMLEIGVSNDIASRPFFQWVAMMVLKQLGGHPHKLRSKTLRIHIPYNTYEQQEFMPPAGLVVAWVVNDYPEPERIAESLARLGVKTEVYLSRDDFFMQATSATHFDAVVIGCDQQLDVQLSMTKSLEVQHSRKQLPVVWLNSQTQDAPDCDVYLLSGCIFDYRLQQALEHASHREAIVPTYLGEQELAWIIVGGSRVTKAIWYAELEQLSIVGQWLEDLSVYDSVLPYHSELVVVLLTPQPVELLQRIQVDYPHVRFVAVQEWPKRPENVRLFEMNTPYSGEQISALKDYLSETNELLGERNE